MSGVGPGENLDVALGVAVAVLPGMELLSLVWLVRLYALAVSVALIVLALRVRGYGGTRATGWPDPREGGSE